MEVRQVRTAEVKLVKTDTPAANIRYIGRSSSLRALDSDKSWQILREYKNGDVLVSTYANMGEFNCTWTDRASYFSAATEDNSNPIDALIPTKTMTPSNYDSIAVTYPTPTSEVYTYSLNSVQVGVVTVTYVDSTKEQVSSVVRT